MPCPLLHEKVDLLREQELKALADAVHGLSKQLETLLAAGKVKGYFATGNLPPLFTHSSTVLNSVNFFVRS